MTTIIQTIIQQKESMEAQIEELDASILEATGHLGKVVAAAADPLAITEAQDHLDRLRREREGLVAGVGAVAELEKVQAAEDVERAHLEDLSEWFSMGLELLPAAIDEKVAQRVVDEKRRHYEAVKSQYAGRIHNLHHRFIAWYGPKGMPKGLSFSDDTGKVTTNAEVTADNLEALTALAEQTQHQLEHTFSNEEVFPHGN